MTPFVLFLQGWLAKEMTRRLPTYNVDIASVGVAVGGV